MATTFPLYRFQVELQSNHREAFVSQLGKDSSLVDNDASGRQALSQSTSAVEELKIDEVALKRLYLSNVLFASGLFLKRLNEDSHDAKIADFHQKCAELERARSGLY